MKKGLACSRCSGRDKSKSFFEETSLHGVKYIRYPGGQK